jgi:hypothetical protein
MLYRLGIILFVLGIVTADSERLVIPATLVSIGMVLIWLGKRREADNEDHI